MKAPIYVLCLLMTCTASAADVVKTCDVGSEHRQRVQIVREAKIASTHIYSILQRDKLTPFFGAPDDSRGESVVAQCVGERQRALIVTGEFTANALQGFVLVSFAGTGAVERLDFAEKNRPGWLYLGKQEVLVVIATLGRGDSNAKYMVYRHAAGKPGSDEVVASNELPPSAGFEVNKLSTAKNSEI